MNTELSNAAEIVEDILANLVEHEDKLIVRETRSLSNSIISIEAHPEDRGKIIGRHGTMADALRTILMGLGRREKCRYVLEIIED